MTISRPFFGVLLALSLFLFWQGAVAAADLYKVLGVEKNASHREIQKAFHKLSLKYHPDKNKAKGAQDKFAEINNAYEILSDEEKRKNYDLYGDEKGRPGFDGGNHGGNNDGYTYFTGGQGNSRFNFRPGGQWHNMGSQGSAESFSSFFGGDPASRGSPFGFGGFGDIFSDFFGGDVKGGQFGGFAHFGRTRSSSTSPSRIQTIDSQAFKKDISDQGLTWVLIFYTPSVKGYNTLEAISEDSVGSFHGAVKAGSINCQSEQALCKEFGLWPLKSARVFVYSYKNSERASLVEYTGDLDAKSLKSFCIDQLPRFSKRINSGQFSFLSSTTDKLPKVLLLSTKKETPVIWRAISGLYRKRVIFYDSEVRDASDSTIRSLGVEALPAVVGWLSNGEKQVLRTGLIKDLKSGMSELRGMLDNFEKKNKKVASGQGSRPPENKSIPVLMSTNMEAVCGQKAAMCVIGVFRSSKAQEKLEAILSAISQKKLTRRQNQIYGSKDTVSFSLLDASKQSTFLNSLDKSGFKSLDRFLVAYRPGKEKFAVYKDVLTAEEVERFISSVLNGDIRLAKSLKKPVLK